jgi:serine/threonine protein kinase
MTEEPSDRTEALFYEAADLPTEEQRALLDAACADDPDLRAKVEKLLADDARLWANEGKTVFLDSPLVRSPTPPTDLPAPAPGPLPTSVGRYRIVRLLGEGGMGAVYEAEQDFPRRSVALKVIRPGLVVPAVLKRFAQEAQILGRLHHPGIAQIYEAGVAEDGQPFFAMELVRGASLDECARRHGLEAAGRLDLVARICDAVQHAHDQGIVHRDLKPSNILVDESGQPRVLDFGVARSTDPDLLSTLAHTRTGHMVGTLAYMSPEQVVAAPGGLDGRSDVYTLGVILFELLAGRLPYPLELLPLPEAARVIREQDPARLGAIDRRLGGDVETIVARALEKDRERRYQSAAELAEDIRRHLRHEPIRARPPSLLYRLGKFVRRRKAAVVAAAALLALLLGGTAVLVVRLRDQAVQQARRSQEVQEALSRAARLREQARSAAGNLGQWAEARAEARRAEAAAKRGPVDPGLAEQIDALMAELNEEEADRRLLDRLEAARQRQTEVDVQTNAFAMGRALPVYREAFADYGLRHDSTDPAEAARLRSRPAVRAQAVAALDHWLDLARRMKAPEADWLEQVLTAADPDDWRQRVRVARRQGKLKLLEDLAREADVAAQPPQALFVLEDTLRIGGSSAGLALLRRAWEAHPDDFWINLHLGMALSREQPPQPHEAIRFLTVAVALRKDSAAAHSNLGNVLAEHDRDVEATAAYRRAVKLKADFAEAHCNLGHSLFRQGKFPEALEEFQSGHHLGSQRKGWPWPYPSDQWVRECELFVELDGRLPAILKGEDRPASAAEHFGLARLCLYKKLHASSVRFWTEAFTAEPRIAGDFRTGQRYRAASVAALAGSGQGEEASRLGPAERARLRRQALEWLRADLAAWDEHLKGRPGQGPSPEAQKAFRIWQTASALAVVRDAEPLAALPADERAGWQRFWADVAQRLAKTRP